MRPARAHVLGNVAVLAYPPAEAPHQRPRVPPWPAQSAPRGVAPRRTSEPRPETSLGLGPRTPPRSICARSPPPLPSCRRKCPRLGRQPAPLPGPGRRPGQSPARHCRSPLDRRLLPPPGGGRRLTRSRRPATRPSRGGARRCRSGLRAWSNSPSTEL